VIGVPGDRADEVIDHAARVAAKGFNRVIVKEDHDLRGRNPGDVANILCRAIRETSPRMECEVVLDEIEALRRAVSQMEKGEVIVHFYEKLLPVQRALLEMAAQPAAALPPTPVRERSTVKRINTQRTALAKSRRIGKRSLPAMPPA
jgi:cyanophycin synthetase